MRWIRQPAAAPLHLCDIAAAPHTQKHLLRSPGQDASTPRPALHAPQRHSRLSTATQKHLTPPRVHSRRPLSGLPAPAPPRYLRAAPPPELRADPRPRRPSPRPHGSGKRGARSRGCARHRGSPASSAAGRRTTVPRMPRGRSRQALGGTCSEDACRGSEHACRREACEAGGARRPLALRAVLREGVSGASVGCEGGCAAVRARTSGCGVVCRNRGTGTRLSAHAWCSLSAVGVGLLSVADSVLLGAASLRARYALTPGVTGALSVAFF